MLTPKQFIDGTFLLIDKPKGWTSFDVIAKLRGPLRKFSGDKNLKLGHTGTLDPMATGLLVIATGKFTKQIQRLQDLDKVYEGMMTLGGTTASYDSETPVIETFDLTGINNQQIISASAKFKGEIEQIPPAYSSIKIEGERAYKKAREGEQVNMKSRRVTVYKFELTSIEIPEIKFIVHCSKGTYIRSIAHDLGQELHCGAYLSQLRRTMIGNYSIEDAHSIEEFLTSISL